MRNLFIVLLVFWVSHFSVAQKIIVGAEQFSEYGSMLKDKKIGIVVNHTSMIDENHLLDFLLGKNINIQAVFTPEHGLKGTADAGEKVNDNLYNNKIPIYSLYGEHKKPTQKEVENLDLILFDIQDVGVRFYTYISTMH